MQYLLFFFHHPATTEIYTLSLHDALPISPQPRLLQLRPPSPAPMRVTHRTPLPRPTRVADRKSTRLNSSHSQISYAVFCLKKKKKNEHLDDMQEGGHEQLQVHYGTPTLGY